MNPFTIDKGVPVDEPNSLRQEDPHPEEYFKLDLLLGGVLGPVPEGNQDETSHDVARVQDLIDEEPDIELTYALYLP